VQYHVLPAAQINPWFGYGLGFEFTDVSQSGGSEDGPGALSRSAWVSYQGFEFARLMAGADLRLHRVVGVGLFLDLTMCNYSRVTTMDGDQITGEVSEPTLHEWFTLGVRGVLFP
jgi:hypothetical protein